MSCGRFILAANSTSPEPGYNKNFPQSVNVELTLLSQADFLSTCVGSSMLNQGLPTVPSIKGHFCFFLDTLILSLYCTTTTSLPHCTQTTSRQLHPLESSPRGIAAFPSWSKPQQAATLRPRCPQYRLRQLFTTAVQTSRPDATVSR